jgi:hypothetical protein
MIRWLVLVFGPLASAHAAQWESSLASVASLRTGGASLVSSDSLALDKGQYALITYWEARSDTDLNVYRCVDITDASFEPVSQACWRALRPTGRAPRVADGVMSSQDLCAQPGNESAIGEIVFCTFSEPRMVRTPYYELTLMPFENGGLVAIRENGRYLLVTDEELPASVVFDVRAQDAAAYPELAGMTNPEELVQTPPDGLQCLLDNIAGNQWVRCEDEEFPFTIAHYLMVGDVVYGVSFNADTSMADRQVLNLMFNSLRPGE